VPRKFFFKFIPRVPILTNAEATTRWQQFCVYNEANECFLSLGATLGEAPLAPLWRMLGLARRRADEGCWLRPQEVRPAFGFGSLRDLLYLDPSYRVVHVAESFPAFRTAPKRSDASSLLALPPRTISFSKTRPGDQLLICAAGEMQSRLRRLHERESARRRESQAIVATPAEPVRTPSPQPSGRPARSFAEAEKLAVHAIRDLNVHGLFLVTRDRWPIGAEVRMSLQPSGIIHQQPISVRMRVTQWGADGVGLEFAGAVNDGGELASPYVC
jgi:hypothetical protein